MGRKSASARGEKKEIKPSCFYCLRTFDNEDTLFQHQKLIHFRCDTCNRKFGNAPALTVHMKTMHDIELKSVPKAEVGRDNPQFHIVGSEGVPQDLGSGFVFENKRGRLDVAASSSLGFVPATSAITADSASSAELAASLVAMPPPTASVATTAAVATGGLVYSDEHVSPEEKRAMLPKYKFDERMLSDKLSVLNSSIEERLRQAMSRRRLTKI